MRIPVTAMAAAALLVLTPLAGSAAASSFPATIDLPTGWGAEGIAIGNGTTAYAGSLSDGSIASVDLRTGDREILVPGRAGGVAVGLKESRGLLYVAGGPNGTASVYDARSGAEVLTAQLGAPFASFINDVVVTTKAAWFTDSFNAVLYRMPLAGGRPSGPPSAVPLSGEWVQVPGSFVFNANGITEAPGGALLVINIVTGTLFAVNPATGSASRVDTDSPLTAGDGILRHGAEVWVVRNRLNQIAVLRLAPDLSSATTVRTLTDPDFDVPTTVAAFGGTPYVVNARFGNPDPAGIGYQIVRVDGT
jgi:hypothetical protein